MANSNWKYVQYKNGKMRTSPGGGGGGASALSDLDDVSISGANDGQVLKYNNAISKWINANPNYLHHYSTTQQIVGTWIDGKPIYEITYKFTSDLNVIQDDWTDSLIQKGNIDKIISSEALHSGSTQWGCVSARVTSSSNYVQLFNSRATSISVRYVIIRYTKTTD